MVLKTLLELFLNESASQCFKFIPNNVFNAQRNYVILNPYCAAQGVFFLISSGMSSSMGPMALSGPNAGTHQLASSYNAAFHAVGHLTPE